ncbi:phosphatase PAP2 family protein [Porphyromonadaceae bacterium OttesenSCG-928-L07]|nr:phosphatase PAP2 family protein [Porphyromonadaceae bacterium OttesenSCG-928-L07]MDL2331146.1 phosphatase PAP2 family protein [Odoribacter sp. OttesenSCG-928-A06]
MLRTGIIIILLSMILTPLYGQSRKFIKTTTDVLFLVNPAAGFLGSIAKEDYKGTKQIVIGGATSLAVTYILKYSISKERPDESDYHSFPSAHTSIAFQGATFLHRRYGFKVAMPAYAVATYVAWGRIYAEKHDIWDVLGGAAIGIGSSLIFTRPFAQKMNLTLAPVTFYNKYPGFYASITF